jgi:hypothetical protein
VRVTLIVALILPLLAAVAFANRTMKWKVLREEPVRVNGKITPCLVIGGSEKGQLFHARKDNGHLAKVNHQEAKIAVERRF